MCSTSCFSNAKIVAGTLLSVMLHVHYLFCLNIGRPMYQRFGKTHLESDGLTFYIYCLYSSFHIPKFDTAHRTRVLYYSQNKQRILRYKKLNYWVFLFIYDLLLRYSYNTWEVTNCSNNQFTTVSLWLFVYVRVKHLKVSAVKNKYYIKKHCSCWCRVYNSRCLVRLCIYFLYCTWRSSKV